MTERRLPSRLAPGFTLVELMVIIVIIGILTAIVAARMTDNIRRSREGGTQGNLAVIRSAVSIYYADTANQYPGSLIALTDSARYLKDLPKAVPADYHPPSENVTGGSSNSVPNDGGGWAYVNDPADVNFGQVWVNCTHTDSKGSLWTSY